MLGQDQITPSDDLWDDLKARAQILVSKLEEGDFSGASEAIEKLNEARDHSIYREVGKLTRGLHEAIANFDIDTQSTDTGAENGSKMTSAEDRLAYVINLTQSSADKTMDMVEEGIPLASELGDGALLLREEWSRLIRREVDPENYLDLYQGVDRYLATAGKNADLLSEKLNTILLAQDFQDLTGQVIKKVINLVQDVEIRLVELMRVAGKVEELTGIVRGVDPSVHSVTNNKELDSAAEGPQVNAEQRKDVVSGQDNVDDLLSSLGF
ncbi:MAG: protein phosphatase CheZ [Oceanicoccus sp.]